MEDRFAEVRAAMDAGDETRARDLLRAEIKANPSAEAYYLASKVAYNDEQSRLFLDRALEIDPFYLPASEAITRLQPTPAEPVITEVGERKPKVNESSERATQLADPIARLIAYFIDWMILAVLGTVLWACVGTFFVTSAMSDNALLSTSVLFSLIINSIYYIHFLANRDGQTPGKSVMNIRVVKKDGSTLTATDAFLRNTIGYFLSGLALFFGFLWIAFDPDREGWHDKIANTIVVRADFAA